MAVHDLLRELVETRGAGVVGDPDQFRGALDDFLDEREASRGEINLLVDAVRLGAVTRIVAMLVHGADPTAALDEVSVALARDRGADTTTGARWALGVIGYALGRVDRTLLTSDRPSSIPTPKAPAPAPAPAPTPEATRAPPPARPTPPAPPAPHGSLPRPEPAPPTAPVDAPADRPGTLSIPEHATAPVPPDRGPAPPPPPRRDERRRRGRALAVAAALLALVVATGVVAVVLTRDGGDGGSDGNGGSGGTELVPGGVLAPAQVVVPVTDDDAAGLYAVNTGDGAAVLLTQGDEIRLPTVSPDRRTVAFVRTAAGGAAPRHPFLLDLGTGEERALLDDDSPCTSTGRPAWSPSGDQLAVACTDESGAPAGTYVVDLRGQEVESLDIDGAPFGPMTWTSDQALVYSRKSDTGGPTALWSYDMAEGTSEPLTDGGGGVDIRPDWSEENGAVLFQRSATDDAESGELWTSADGSETRVEVGHPAAFPVWSSDGKQLAFVAFTEDGRRLATASYADPSDERIHDQVPGEAGAPAW